MSKGFAIQEYHDVKDIYERIGKLVDNPIRPPDCSTNTN